MLPRFRRSFYGKFLVIGFVITCFIIYFKLPISKIDNLQSNNNEIDDQLLLLPRNNQQQQKLIVENQIKRLVSNENNNNEIYDNLFIKNQEYEHLIKAELAKQVVGLGDNGESVQLTDKAKKIGEEQYKKIALNEELSQQISYNRTLPDARDPLCETRKYDLNNLLTTSVIIIFYNEPFSVLIRTVHSVLNTADQRILKEIILVDDGSTNAELIGKLDYYVSTRFPKNVKILRLKQRLGLIRARLAGARLAIGEVLLFLDAHCECIRQWLEPLVERIKESKTSVVVPIIDVIDAKDFQYSTNYRTFQVGGFDWTGHFDWIDISEREKKRIKRECTYEAEICPTHSPTMAGGLFAISREYFWEIGSYDEQMDGWGGENLEMSFRIWQCGGTIETIPCSRVGHVFRDFHPYKFPNDKDTHGINTVRMAKVWMDEYIDFLYLNRPDLKYNEDVGDVTHRLMLRKKLKCKSFEWFLKNIYPEKFIPTKNVKAYGHFRSGTMCLDDLQSSTDSSYELGLFNCMESLSKSQFFSLTLDGILRSENNCARVKPLENGEHIVAMDPCHYGKTHQKWTHMPSGHLMNQASGLCLDRSGLKMNDKILVKAFDRNNVNQKWKIEH